MKKIAGQPVIRSQSARAAWERQGAGSHGGSVRQKNRRDRKAVKRDLKGASCSY